MPEIDKQKHLKRIPAKIYKYKKKSKFYYVRFWVCKGYNINGCHTQSLIVSEERQAEKEAIKVFKNFDFKSAIDKHKNKINDIIKMKSLEFISGIKSVGKFAEKLGYEVVEHGGLAGAAFNAAKEEALDNFINYKLSFPGMAHVVRATMDELNSKNELDGELEIERIMELDLIARSIAKKYIEKI